MPSSYTANYQLNQWALSDKVSHLDFNADNAKIDAALKAETDARAALSGQVDALAGSKADASALTGLQSAVSALQTEVARKQEAASAVRVAAGYYTGNGKSSQSISVGFQPKAVYIVMQDGRMSSTSGQIWFCYGGLAVTGASLKVVHDTTTVTCATLNSTGFTVYFDDSSTYCKSYVNLNGGVFHYVAIG